MIVALVSAFILIIIVYSLLRFKAKSPVIPAIVSILIAGVGSFIIYDTDIESRIADIEMWSGSVTKVEHTEEWDEWHKPWTETITTTDSEGNTSSVTVEHQGYWEHHSATNYIWTSDGGMMSISVLPDGKIANDNYINSTEELKVYFPLGMPSASFHTYRNKVKASYSIFKTNSVDENKYTDLPEYPSKINNYIEIKRIIGFNNITKKSNDRLSEVNTYLNKQIPDPEKEGKTRSWKQVNIVLVNVGTNKSDDYGYALQNKWRNGSKNDVVISVSLDENGKVLWCHPFSWSDSKLFQLEIRDYVTGLTLSNDDEMICMIDEISNMIEDGFVRKQFADFNYLKIEMSNKATIVMGVFYLITLCGIIYYVEHRE